jgi:thymidylate synthase ThyX
MTEQNKFIKVDTIQLYNDSIGAVSLYDASYANSSEEQRIWCVTTAASLAYGNEEAKNPEALYERMKSIKHESLWEMIRFGSSIYTTIEYSMRGNELIYDSSDEGYSSKTDIKLHKQNIACFRIKVPMFVRAQFMRHRSASYLEMSRRYTKGSKVPFQFWFPENMLESFYTEEQPIIWLEEYNNLIGIGIETQEASRFLPQVTYTEFYCMFEIEGLKNFMKLRLDSHSQKPIRETAEAMLELLRIHQPELYKKVLP